MTHPFPLLEPSLTPSRMPKPSVRKHCFQNKMFLFSKTYYQVSVKSIGQPSEVNCCNFLKQFMGPSDVNCWTTLQGNSSENLHLKFLSQPFFFLFCFMSCTHTYCSRLPSVHEMHYVIFIQYMPIYQSCIYRQNSHINHMLFIHSNNIKISSHGLINNSIPMTHT